MIWVLLWCPSLLCVWLVKIKSGFQLGNWCFAFHVQSERCTMHSSIAKENHVIWKKKGLTMSWCCHVRGLCDALYSWFVILADWIYNGILKYTGCRSVVNFTSLCSHDDPSTFFPRPVFSCSCFLLLVPVQAWRDCCHHEGLRWAWYSCTNWSFSWRHKIHGDPRWT